MPKIFDPRRSGYAPRASAMILLATAMSACAAPQIGPPEPVRPGIDVLLASGTSPLHGRRVGLVTNHTGVDAAGRSTIDRLHESDRVELIALFSPEHGIRGVVEHGEVVASEIDQRTGLPIYSLYGDTRKPTPEMLQGIEALAFDIQDVGARQYTYVSTMSLAMEAAAEHGIPIVILDRPNPIGGEIVEGGILEPGFESFVGRYPISSRHGMTVGELARMFNDEFGVGADLTVIPVAGWERHEYFDETGLPWINPSPNIRSLEAAIHYAGTVLIEGTTLSEGRGTDLPFEQIGAPWLDGEALAREMNAMNLPGVRFEPVRFSISDDVWKLPGETVSGVRLFITDRDAYRPLRATLLLIDAARRQNPEAFGWTATINRLSGTDRVRSAIEAGTLHELLAEWDADAERFREIRRPYLIY